MFPDIPIEVFVSPSGVGFHLKIHKTVGTSHWNWGIQWRKRLREARLVEAPAKLEVKEQQTLHWELYDYDYNGFRAEDTAVVPAVFWELSQEELEKRLKIGKYTPTGEEEET